LQGQGTESIANAMTVEKCTTDSTAIPSTGFTQELTIDFNGEQIDCRFFGAGHSFDNITVWIPSEKILVGGCLVRSSHANSLGNLSDAVVEEWDKTVENVLHEYPNASLVLPGHGDMGGTELLEHTIDLVRTFRKK